MLTNAQKIITGVLGRAGVTAPALLNLNDRIVFFGDSITANGIAVSGADNAFMSNGYTTWAQATAGSQLYMPPSGNKGVSSDTTTLMLARISGVTALSPKCVVMNGGTNDVAGGVSAATIQSNLATIYSTLLAAGVKYIIDSTVTPRFSPLALTGPQETVRQAVNTWKLSQATSRLKVVNLESAMNSSALYADGLHPNTPGAYTQGALYGAALSPLITSGEILGSAVNVFSPNPTMTGTGGSLSGGATGSVATSWALKADSAGGATVAGSKTTISGHEWQVITLSGAKTGTNNNVTLESFVATGTNGTPIVAGDLIEFMTEIEVASLANVKAIRASIIIFDAGFATLAQAESMYASTDGVLYPATARMTMRTPPVTVAAGIPATNFFFFAVDMYDGAVSPAGTIRIGRNIARRVPGGA